LLNLINKVLRNWSSVQGVATSLPAGSTAGFEFRCEQGIFFYLKNIQTVSGALPVFRPVALVFVSGCI